MFLWQNAMIRLARNERIKNFVQNRRFMNGLATKFVGGGDINSAIAKAIELQKQNITASLYYLGEYVEIPELIEKNVAQIISVVKQLGQSNLDVHVSIDPTQIGYAISDKLGKEKALRIGRVLSEQAVNGRRNLLMLDMEDFSVVQKTLNLQATLAQEGIPTAIAIQAYLYRSEQDINNLIKTGAAVRLVKGAFAENEKRAFTKKKDINNNFVRLSRLLLSPEAKASGVYPIFGTHDDQMIKEAMTIARENQWSPDEYEFEMLYGVRIALQRKLVAEGYSLRLYLPFGTEWWPYSVRRVGENPANLRFIFNAMLRE
jgi:proline dehydrogenase